MIVAFMMLCIYFCTGETHRLPFADRTVALSSSPPPPNRRGPVESPPHFVSETGDIKIHHRRPSLSLGPATSHRRTYIKPPLALATALCFAPPRSKSLRTKQVSLPPRIFIVGPPHSSHRPLLPPVRFPGVYSL
jgi:hypothetical protein